MVTIYDVLTQELIEKTAVKLKDMPEIQPPSWAAYVKTSSHKERPPQREDWWYVRSASVLRNVYKSGPIGVSKLRIRYGGKKNRGVATEHSFKGSGNIIRKILQQLEKAQLIRHIAKEVHKGRIVTQKGKSLLDKTATEIYKQVPRQEIAHRPEIVPETKKAHKTERPVEKTAEQVKVKEA